jgi:arylsulfatase A-like enzyme
MSERPNLLLITTDQQRFDTIAALGNPDIHTPHLDWLTDEGITFTRAYTDCPICMAARTTIMTGKHGYSIGITGNGGMERAAGARPTLPGVLTAAGYQTRAQGKMHFAPMRRHYGFETMELPMDYYRERHRLAHEGLPKEHGVGENETVPVISTVDETHSLTYWTVRRSIDFLETRDETRPFFLWTSFAKPHPPLDPCANYWALYANRPVAPPVYGDWSADIAKMPQGFLEPTYCLNNAYRMSDHQLADMKRAYYACITQIDYQLGLLFARMREMRLLENTWIVFTADHGDMLGDHRMGAKSTFLEGSAHIPFIIRPPAASWKPPVEAGARVEARVGLADVMPTLLAVAGVPVPADLDGTNLLALPAGPDRPFFGACGGNQFGVMRGSLKYCFALKGGEELLFDLASDPREQRNLTHVPEYAAALRELRTELRANLARHCPELVRGNDIITLPAVTGPRQVAKWPGFHSTVVPADVLH